MALTIALLRAVNVGGRKLVMSELRAMLADLGHPDARTLLQSGNLVFDAGARSGAELEAWLEAETLKRFGLAADYLVRTVAEWSRVIAANPFPAMARNDPSHLVVMPLKSAPAEGALATLRAAIPGREQADLIGRNLYLTYPDAIARLQAHHRPYRAPTRRPWHRAELEHGAEAGGDVGTTALK